MGTQSDVRDISPDEDRISPELTDIADYEVEQVTKQVSKKISQINVDK